MNFTQVTMKIVGFILLIYLTIVLILFIGQRKLLYFPYSSLPTEEFLQAKNLQYWVNKTNNYRGLISQLPSKHSQGIIVIFHGNAGAAIDRSYYVEALTSIGYRVLLAEYPGYGGREGKLSEKSFVTDGREIIKYLHQQYDQPIYVWGESLGSGVVAAIASDDSLPIKGIMLITPWDSLPNLAQTLYQFFPTKWLVLDRFNSINNLKSFKGKIGILIAGKDEVIPAQLGYNLYQSLPDDKKKLWVLANANHNTWSDYLSENWWPEVMEFLSVN